MTRTSELRLRFEKEPAFCARDIRTFFAGNRLSEGYRNLMVHKLLRDGKLQRIGRGIYTFRQETQVVGFAFQPFYYGLQDALSLRNLWEQETVPVVVTPRKVRAGKRKFLGSNYIVRRIGRSMFFGFDMVKYGDFWVPVSDLEKTLIDFVHFRQPLSRELVLELRKSVRSDVMGAYLKRVPEKLAKRVGMLLG